MDQTTKKRIGKLKTEYRKKAKELGFTLKIGRDDYVIDLIHDRDKEHYQSLMISFAGVVKIDELGKYYDYRFGIPQYKEEAEKLAYGYWSDYATIIDAGLIISAIVLDEAAIIKKENLSTFRFISEGVQECWAFVELKENYLQKLFHVLKAYENQIVLLKQKDPTFNYRFRYDFAFSTVDVYYQGLKEDMVFQKNENSWSISFLNECIHFQTSNELNKAFPEMMKKIENKQRLKNLSNPPKYHFNRLIESTIHTSTQLKEKIYNNLLQQYTPQQIEEHIAKLDNELSVIVFEQNSNVFNENSVRFFELLDTIFILDAYENVLSEANVITYPIEEFDKAKAHFDQLVIRLVIGRNQKKFEQIQQKAKEKKPLERSV